MSSMKRMKYEVRFLTPAFLGNAEQRGQWRTPPFKALLRQWWRVVWAADRGFPVDISEMRCQEGALFGNTWLSHREKDREVNDYSKSQVRLRLSKWSVGELSSWAGLEQRIQVGKNKIGSHAYLGYGPLDARRGTQFARDSDSDRRVRSAIDAGEKANLLVTVPERRASDIRKTFALIDAYSAAGGRSRNGWGSIALVPVDGNSNTPNIARPWLDALALDWPHAIGCDQVGPLVWRTKSPRNDWKLVMRDLACVKIGLREQFPFQRGHNVQDRHWLSYPVTKHKVEAWGSDKRLPNSLRFKVRRDADNPRMLRGVIFHMPCLPPGCFSPDREAIKSVWQRVHKFLDNNRDVVERFEW